MTFSFCSVLLSVLYESGPLLDPRDLMRLWRRRELLPVITRTVITAGETSLQAGASGLQESERETEARADSAERERGRVQAPGRGRAERPGGRRGRGAREAGVRSRSGAPRSPTWPMGQGGHRVRVPRSRPHGLASPLLTELLRAARSSARPLEMPPRNADRDRPLQRSLLFSCSRRS